MLETTDRDREREDERVRMQRFGEAIDAVRHRVEAAIGAEDAQHVVRVRRFSTAMEIAGRILIHVSPGPASFMAGVGALWLHKQLEATEIGHTALHGAYDGVPGAEKFRSEGFAWDVPIDEEAWKYGHNVRHHQYTNVAGRDPDIHFGPIRLNEHTPHRPIHYLQVPLTLVNAATFCAGMNLHFTGVADALRGNGRPEQFDFLKDRSPESVRAAWRKAMRKYVPYYTKNFLFYPALAGPFFWKVLLGNWMAETMRDLYSAATIYCGHVGEDVADYPAGTRAHGRGEWYRMQIEATNDFEVPLPVSMLCGALDKQIEHHLFPRFPTNRLREVAPEVRRICREHGVEYRTDSWGRTLGRVVKRLARLSFPSASKPRAAVKAEPEARRSGVLLQSEERLRALA